MSKSQLFNLTRRMLVLGVLSLALVFLLLDKVTVKADDCMGAWDTFFDGFRGCAESDECNPYSMFRDRDKCFGCFEGLGNEQTIWSDACGLPSHTPMTDPYYTCQENKDRFRDNCIAGTLPYIHAVRYNQCLADYGPEADINVCCDVVTDEVFAQGCY